MDIAPSPASASRKRERENETPSQRHKREKAAERQRRKRERDRNNGNNTPLTPAAAAAAAPGVLFSIPPNEHQQESPGYAQANRQGEDSLLSPEELARRDKVRKAARERQRKHRALVKDRRMRELGLDMGNEISEIPYHGGHVQDPHHYSQAVMGHHELGHHPQHVGEGQPQVQGGEMFASTLLLSFSCAPLLKQHLLSTLSMTSEELTSFEPIIAEAWEHWDRQRRARYAQQAASGGGPSSSSFRHDVPEPSTSFSNGTSHTNASVSDFRSRFQRSIVAPSPFRTNTTFRAASDTTGSNASNTSSSDKEVKKGDESKEGDEEVAGESEKVT